MIDFYGGSGTFSSWSERVRGYARDTAAVNIRDWQSAFGWPLSPGMLDAIDVPSLIVWGAESHPAVQRANAQLAANIRTSQSAVLGGAAHFMIATHANDVAALISRHVEQAARHHVRRSV